MRCPPLVLSLGSPPVRQPADILLLFFPPPLLPLLWLPFSCLNLRWLYFLLLSFTLYTFSFLVHSPPWVYCVGFSPVRFPFHDRGWVFAWGVAGRELSVQDGDSEDEQGMSAATHPCLPLSLASVLTACFLLFVPCDVIHVASLDLMTVEAQSAQVARIYSFPHVNLLPLPNFAPFCFPPFPPRDIVIIHLGCLIEGGYSSSVLRRR